MRSLGSWVGRWGEWLVGVLLRLRGFRIVERNWRTKGGELDIVALRMGTLLVVEVKTRSRGDRGAPSDALTFEKRRRVIWATRRYLRGNRRNVRRVEFALAEVVLRPFPRVRLVRDAFRADDVRAKSATTQGIRS